MKLLVTGGAGFIGSNFIYYWLKNHPDDDIVNLDNLTYAGNLENLRSIQNNPHYRFIKGDICNVDDVTAAMHAVDVVVHFAAESHVDRSILSPSIFVMSNVVGTQTLLDAALKQKVKRFHHISTDEVYGTLRLDTREKFSENSPYNPRSPYSATKAASDHLVRAYHITYGLPVTITNCSNNFGPFQFPEKLIPLAITNLLEGKSVPMYGRGDQVRDWLYVEDHCRAIDVVIHKGEVGETYCVGGQHEELSNLDVVKKIIGLIGKKESKIKYVKDRPGHDVRYAMDWTKIHMKLGWKPKYDFDKWLEKTVEWFQSNQEWWKRVKSGEYQEYYQTLYAGR
jgi:dTDP-glucose 4,6-dehydratase